MQEFVHNWIVPPHASAEPLVYAVTAVLALLITAVSKGGFGGGVGMISVPMMLQVAPVRFVIGLWLPLLIVCDLATIQQYPKEWNPRAFWKLAPGIMLGIILTTLLLGNLDPTQASDNAKRQEAWLKVGIAAIALVFVALQNRPKAAENPEPWKPSWRVSLPVGLVAGVTTMLAHAAGTIITMFLLPQKMEKRVFVGTTGRFFCIFNAVKVPFYMTIGLVDRTTLRYGLWLALIAPLGVFLGAWMNRRLNALWFVRLMYICLIASAAKLIYDGWKVLA